MAKDKLDPELEPSEVTEEDDGNAVVAGGSYGPGRGVRLTSLPEHSVAKILPPEKQRQLALWAISHVRLTGYEDDAMQVIMFAFMRHSIPPGTKKKEVLKAATTTAKRWALEVKRTMAYPVTLEKDDFFNKASRDQCIRADADLGMDEDASDELKHVSFVEGLEAGDEMDFIDWSKIPDNMSKVIDEVWHQSHPRVQKVMRHVLMGDSIARAAELEAVAYQTAVTHQRTFTTMARALA